HHEVILTARDFVDLAEAVVWHLDQPVADPAGVANYRVAELAAKEVKMVLTGEGGDELFAGYARYSAEGLSPAARPVPAPLRSLALAGTGHVPGLRRPKLGLFALCQEDEVTRLANWFPLFDRRKKASLLAPGTTLRGDVASENEVIARELSRTDATDALSR